MTRPPKQYRNTVLSGFQDVANALRTLELDAQALKIQLEAERSARENFEITRERFRAGAISYLSMLDAERVDQQARINLVQAQGNRFADTVLLFQALGGGWWNRDDSGPMSEADADDAADAMPRSTSMPVTYPTPSIARGRGASDAADADANPNRRRNPRRRTMSL